MSEISLSNETPIGLANRSVLQIGQTRAVGYVATRASDKSLIKLTNDVYGGNRREAWVWLILAVTCAGLVVLSFLIPYL